MKREWTYDTRAKRWERCEVTELRLFGGLRDALRRRREGNRAQTVYDFDARTLTMRDRRAERRWLRLARRAERFARVSKAVLSMVEMQKHIG